ncbi:MAG: peptidase S9 [Chitinispirillia bacterium]|nr:peptidase S9 [Chitinispirillia bacterium]
MITRQIITAILALIWLLTAQASPQYFGQNKVQYHTFDFKEMKTDNLRILYYPSQEEAAQRAALKLERWYARFREIFERPLSENQPIILYANHAEFQQTNAIGGLLSQSTGGVTEGLMNRVVVPLTGINSENDHVLGHELVHAFHYDMIRKSEGGLARAGEIPLWFIEGMSEYLSLGPMDGFTAMWMRDAVLNDDVPAFEQLTNPYHYFPYRFGHAIWAYMTGEYGDQTVYNLFNGVLRHGWYPAYRRVLSSSVDSASAKWVQALKDHFEPTLEGRTLVSETGYRIISGDKMNLVPSVSPDGNLLAFMSTKDIFDIDLFLADARSGKVIRKLLSSQNNRHFDALRFINSSGAWSHDSRQLAVVVFRNGRNEIAVVDVENGRVKKKIALDGVDEITGICWSSDGKYIAAAGTKGGIGDLFLYNFHNDSTAKLTDGRYSALQPAFSPDGSAIAFVTDMGPLTDFESLTFGPMKIALLSLDDYQIELISIADWARHINPQFSPCGRYLFMIADPDGVSDIYRYTLDDGEVRRITNVVTGISGLSALTPAISLSKESGEMVFTVFNKRSYEIRGFSPSELVGYPFTINSSGDITCDNYIDSSAMISDDYSEYRRVISLRPEPAPERKVIVDKYLNTPSKGLPVSAEFPVTDYRPRFRLLYIGQIYAGMAADRYGVGVAGGASFLFSDLLGDHILGLSAQINGGVSDVGAQVVYINRRQRPGWGVALSRMPYYSGWIQHESIADTSVYTIIEQRVFENRISTFAEYPLTLTKRMETGIGYIRYSYDYSAEHAKYKDGRFVSSGGASINEPASLNLIQTNAAFVGDASYFGFTAPISGYRYRLEVEPTFGNLAFMGALADYRRYHFKNPFTLAWRLLHYGRYFGDSETDRLTPLYLGFETWVRGYSLYSLLRSGNVGSDLNQFPEISTLIGSRIAVSSMELRLPLVGTEQFGILNFPYLPTDVLAFVDAGVAWTKNDDPDFHWKRKDAFDRTPIVSAGLSTRTNLLGLLILQIYYAYPFQHPEHRMRWGFFIAPGW